MATSLSKSGVRALLLALLSCSVARVPRRLADRFIFHGLAREPVLVGNSDLFVGYILSCLFSRTLGLFQLQPLPLLLLGGLPLRPGGSGGRALFAFPLDCRVILLRLRLLQKGGLGRAGSSAAFLKSLFVVFQAKLANLVDQSERNQSLPGMLMPHDKMPYHPLRGVGVEPFDADTR